MASDATFFEVLEADLRSLSSEARKTDSLATQITGWLQHTDFPLIKECAERALLRLRAISQEGKGIEAVRTKVSCIPAYSRFQPIAFKSFAKFMHIHNSPITSW